MLPFETKVYLLFAAFILLCGITHFLDPMMFWIPMYRLNALVRFFTGIVSMLTVYYLFKILPQVFRQKSNTKIWGEAQGGTVSIYIEDNGIGIEESGHQKIFHAF